MNLMLYASRYILLFFLLMYFIFSCNQPEEPAYTDQLGDIPFQSKLDNPDFKLCNSEDVKHSRLSLTYDGGWDAIEDEFQQKFKSQSAFQTFTGYIMVRFLINCDYDLGRFRVETMDLRFNPQKAPDILMQHLLSIVKDLNKWQRTERYTGEVDCSKFLNFKIVDGRIESIIH